jgi:hypothetical protein
MLFIFVLNSMASLRSVTSKEKLKSMMVTLILCQRWLNSIEVLLEKPTQTVVERFRRLDIIWTSGTKAKQLGKGRPHNPRISAANKDSQN